MYAVLSRVPVREHLISSICWGRSFVQRSLTEPCYNSLSRSRSFRNCHVALLLVLHVCYRVNGIFCLFWLVFFFNVIFPLSLCSLSSTHACMHVFFWERLVILPSSHPFIHFSTYLPFYLIYLHDMRKMRLLLWYAENRFTGRDIFSSKITFLYDPCVFIFRIFNKLNNITWKSVLSPTSSPFSC